MHYALCIMHYALCSMQGWAVGTSWAQRHGESSQDTGGLLCHAFCNIFASQNLQALISQRPARRDSPEVKRHIDQKSAMVITGLASERSLGVEKVSNAERAVSTCLLVYLSTCLLVCLSACLLVCLSAGLFVYFSTLLLDLFCKRDARSNN